MLLVEMYLVVSLILQISTLSVSMLLIFLFGQYHRVFPHYTHK